MNIRCHGRLLIQFSHIPLPHTALLPASEISARIFPTSSPSSQETCVNIRPVQNIKDLNAFIELPYRLYKNEPIWIPPLRDEQRGQFDPKRNPLLDHCAWQLFLLEDAGRTIGRIAAFIDTLAVDFWKEAIGLFGYYECVPDPSTGSPVPACPAVSHRRAAVACGTNGGGQARAALAQAGRLAVTG